MLVVRNPPAKAGDAKDSGLSPRLGRSPEVGNGNLLQYTCLQCLATHSSILARKKVMNRGAWWLQSMGLQTVRHNWAHTHTHTHTHTVERRVPPAFPWLLPLPFMKDRGAFCTFEPLHLLFLPLRCSSLFLQSASSFSAFSPWLTCHYFPEDSPDHSL